MEGGHAESVDAFDFLGTLISDGGVAMLRKAKQLAQWSGCMKGYFGSRKIRRLDIFGTL